MILKDEDQRQLACDDCGYEGDVFDADEFSEMITEARSDGWSITQPSGKWTHHCPDCAPETALAQAKRKFGVR